MCVFFCTFAAEFNYSMALTRTYYRVAEHLFAVECGDSALLQCMTNYEPFAVEGDEAKGEVYPINSQSLSGTPQRLEAKGEGIFTLRVEGDKQKARGEEWTHVLTDNAESFFRP